MDKVEKYRKALTETLEKYAGASVSTVPHPHALDIHLLFDRDRDHYQVLGLGWENDRQTCLVIFHFAIQGGKIWLHRNVADYDILEDLENRGIPKEDIVLAFQPPAIRPYTGYAVA
jgi:hypothetical protein